MGWKILLLCFVGIASATVSNSGWKVGTSHTYDIRGRTLSGHQTGHQYNGILTKGRLNIIVKSDDVLVAKIHYFEYARIHTHLPDGALSHIPESQLKFEEVHMTDSWFEIRLHNGIVREIRIKKETPRWEVNVIKSIVSQIQLDTKGENAIHGRYHQLPEESSNFGIFTTMEDSITGKYETLYELGELPEVEYQEQPWLVPYPHLKGVGKIIEVVKTRNLSRSEGHIGYHYGFDSAQYWKPFSNNLGEYFAVSSGSRAVLSGTLNRFTIQSIISTHVMTAVPSLNKDQKIMVISRYNLTLSDIKAHEHGSKDQDFSTGYVSWKSLTYTYATPYLSEDLSMMKKPSENIVGAKWSEENARLSSGEEFEKYSLEHALDWYPLTQGPPSFSYINEMREMKKNLNVVENIKKLAEQIGNDLLTAQWIQNRQTLPKFLVMVQLLRVLDEKELREVTYELYTEEKKTLKTHIWMTFRDGLVESGSGPSLLVLKKLIEENKVHGETAAQLVVRAARSVRQPSYEYMRTFYALSTDKHVQSQSYLNVSVSLAFAELVGKVYVNNETSLNKYPTKAYGNFQTKTGTKFVLYEYIPHLQQELDKAIAKNDNQRAQVYIYSLGYVAHPLVFAAFEKYLEGKVEVSQFLRTQMVVALRRMSKINPEAAEPVLYKIYRNPGEHQDVRIAAVQNLMYTVPSADMLQKIVEYTKRDANEFVNSAVYSIIKSAAELTTPENAEFQTNAQAAVHLFKEDEISTNSLNYIQDAVFGPMFSFTHTLHSIGSEDSFYAKAMRYALRTNIGGMDKKAFSVEYMISSFEALTEVIKQQLQRETNADSGSKWSGGSIRDKLKIKGDKIEEVEGNIRFDMGGMEKFFTFDAQMLKQLVKVVMDMEDALRETHHFHYNKVINSGEMEASFPTETGFLYLYSNESPFLIQVKGNMSGYATPKIASEGKLRNPDEIYLGTEVEISFSKMMREKIGFYSPFDSKSYYAGYDKNIHSYLPLKMSVYGDLKQNKYEVEVEIDAPSERVHVMDISTEAYTSEEDFITLPTSKVNRHVIDSKPSMVIDHVLGEKATGMAWRFHLTSDKRPLNLDWLTSFFTDIHNSKLKIVFDNERSENRKIKFHLATHQHTEWSRSEEEEVSSTSELEQLFHLPEDREEKHTKLYEEARAGIRIPEISMYESNVTFEGKRQIKYNSFVALSSSGVDEKSKILLHSQKHDIVYPERDYKAALVIHSTMPKINELDPFFAFELDPKSKVSAELAFGNNYESSTKVRSEINLGRSEERLRLLQDSRLKYQCTMEAAKKNYQLPACLKFIQSVPLLDQIKMSVLYENVNLPLKNLTNHLLDFAQYSLYGYSQVNLVNASGSGDENTVKIDVNFRKTLDEVSVILRTMDRDMKFDDVKIPKWIRPVVVVHPQQSAITRWLKWATNAQTTGPSCSVDHSAVNTFDKKTYEVRNKDYWTVMFVYVPNIVKHHENSHKQIEEYAVLTRGKGDEHREVKISLRVPESHRRNIEIDLLPQTNGAQVFVNQQELTVTDEEVVDINDGLVQMYLLPNHELKIKIKDAFHLYYDGKRVRLDMPINNKFANKVRGMCGTGDGHTFTDFKAPHNCIYNNLEQFVEAYQPENNHHHEFRHNTHPKWPKCTSRKLIYSDVITGHDLGVCVKSQNCSKFKTRYVEKNDEICFSEKLFPVCQSGCKSERYNNKVVNALCLKKDSERAIKMMEKLENNSNLTFNRKDVQNMTKITMKVPQHCYAQ